MGRIEPGRPTGAGIGGGRPALGLLVLLTLVVGGCRGAEAPECPPGAAGCQCTEPFAARGCAPGLVCLVGLCLGGEVPVPDGYLFTAEALDDEDRIDGILKDRIDLAPGMVVVDIGAGDGFFTRHAARRVSPGGRVWATDIDPAALESIRESIEAAPDRAVLDAAITQRLARTPWDTALEDLPDGSADLVAMFRVFTFQIADHAKNLDYLREIARKVRPGGRLVYHIDWVNFSRYRLYLVLLMRAAGFTGALHEIPMPEHIPEMVETWDWGAESVRDPMVPMFRGFILVFERGGVSTGPGQG